MVKPLALPMPWIGGGTSTKPVASGMLVQRGLQVRGRWRAGPRPVPRSRPVLQHHIDRAGGGERGVVVQRRDAGDLDRLVHAGRGARDRRGLRQHRIGAFQRRAVRQLQAEHQVALILDRNERGGQPRDAPDAKPARDQRQQRQRPGVARHAADQRRIATLQRRVGAVEAAEEEVALLHRHRRAQPQRALRRLQRRGVDRREQRGGGDDDGELRVHPAGQARAGTPPARTPTSAPA